MSEQQTQKNSPLGVKMLTGLAGFIALLMFIGGATMIALAPAAPTMFTEPVPPEHLPKVSVLFASVGSMSISLGAAFVLIGYGLWTGRAMAWNGMRIAAFIGIGISVIAIAAGAGIGYLNLVLLILGGAVVYYLYRPHVMEYFNNAVTRQTR